MGLAIGHQAVERTGNLDVIADQDVQVHHCGFHVAVAKQFLDGADIDVVEQQVGGERMTKRVRRDRLADVGLFDGFVETRGKRIAVKTFINRLTQPT